MANEIYIPLINPLRFYDPAFSQPAAYQSKQFDDYAAADRLVPWQEMLLRPQVWQNTDRIRLQFISSFDPVVVELLTTDNRVIVSLPTLIGLPNKFMAGFYSFEADLSLATVPDGCYRLRLKLGSGPNMKTLESPLFRVSVDTIPDTLLLEYWNDTTHADVMFETGIKFQYRIPGWLHTYEPSNRVEAYRDERNNPVTLSARSSRQFTVQFGTETGVNDDEVDLLRLIWSCRNVLIDGKPFGVVDGGKMEFITIDTKLANRGVSIKVEEGVNRFSSIYSIERDTTKRLLTAAMVDPAAIGDTANSGNSNLIPITIIE